MVSFCCSLWKADRWSNWSDLAACWVFAIFVFVDVISLHRKVWSFHCWAKTHMASQLWGGARDKKQKQYETFDFFHFFFHTVCVGLAGQPLVRLPWCLLSQTPGQPQRWSCWFRSGCKQPSRSHQQWGSLITQTIVQLFCRLAPTTIANAHRHTDTTLMHSSASLFRTVAPSSTCWSRLQGFQWEGKLLPFMAAAKSRWTWEAWRPWILLSCIMRHEVVLCRWHGSLPAKGTAISTNMQSAFFVGSPSYLLSVCVFLLSLCLAPSLSLQGRVSGAGSCWWLNTLVFQPLADRSLQLSQR